MTRAFALAGLVALAAGCAAHRWPAQDPQRALYRDLERLVTFEEAKGWNVDRIEVEQVLPEALDSVCRVHPEARRALAAWIDTQIAALGGPVEDAWRRQGKRLSRVEGLLMLTRVGKVLTRADQAADADCPFWVEPEDGFSGRQISDDRWEITGGGGGIGILVHQGDSTDLQFGGTGRLLFGRVLGSDWALYGGLEIGASGSFPKDAVTGERGQLVVAVDLVPLLSVRRILGSTYWEVEGGAVGHATEEAPDDVAPGFHVGLAFGGRATRTRFFFPGAAFGVSYERVRPDGEEALHFVKVGLRVAFDLDL